MRVRGPSRVRRHAGHRDATRIGVRGATLVHSTTRIRISRTSRIPVCGITRVPARAIALRARRFPVPRRISLATPLISQGDTRRRLDRGRTRVALGTRPTRMVGTGPAIGHRDPHHRERVVHPALDRIRQCTRRRRHARGAQSKDGPQGRGPACEPARRLRAVQRDRRVVARRGGSFEFPPVQHTDCLFTGQRFGSVDRADLGEQTSEVRRRRRRFDVGVDLAREQCLAHRFVHVFGNFPDSTHDRLPSVIVLAHSPSVKVHGGPSPNAAVGSRDGSGP